MKTNWNPIKPMLIGVGVLVMATTFGQTVYTWTGAGDGTNLSSAANWDPVGLPNGNNGTGFQDTARWDGRTTTNLVIGYENPSLPNTGFGSLGINLHITSTQTNSVQIHSSQNPQSPGVGINDVFIDAGAGAFTWGDDDTPNNLLTFGRPAGAVHHWVNNSTHPATIGRSIRWQAGGGAGYTYAFSGTGDWIVNSALMPDAGAFTCGSVQVDGPGTVLWRYGTTNAYAPNTCLGWVAVNGGKLIIRSSGLFSTQGQPNQPITNNAILIFDAPADAQVLNGVISGGGLLVVSNGTLTLGGASVYTGNTLLAGGTLVVSGPETQGVSGPLGQSNTITFAGGTLGYSPDNFWDYSDRFVTAAGQAYRIDTSGQDVTFTNNLASSGGTLSKLGLGNLTLAGSSSYSGSTTISAGKLVFQAAKTGTSNITVADGAALGLVDTGTPITPDTLTLGAGGGAILEFDNVHSTTTTPLSPTALASTGPVTIQINSGVFVTGQSYPLLTWSSGAAPAVSLGTVDGALGFLSVSGNSLQFNVTSTALVWNGTNGASWTNLNNWTQDGFPTAYSDPAPVLLDDTATGTTSVTVEGVVQPTSVTVNTSNQNYSISTSVGNNIAGNTGLTKRGSGTLTVTGGANTYTGVTKISAGTLNVGSLADGGVASDIGASSNAADKLVLDGGTLEYTGAEATMDRLFTLTTGGGALEASGTGALRLTNSGAIGLSGGASRSFTLGGTNVGDNLLAGGLTDGTFGRTSLTKGGTGRWVITGGNTYAGGTVIGGGTLQVGAGGTSGSLGSGATVNNGNLVFNRSDTTTNIGQIQGPGEVIQNGAGTLVLVGNQTYTGITTINAGILQLGNGSSSAMGLLSTGIVNNSTLTLNQSMTLGAVISGPGAVTQIGGGGVIITADNTYSGGTIINSGKSLTLGNGGTSGSLGTGPVTINGSLDSNRSDDVTLTNVIHGSGRLYQYRTNTYTLTAASPFTGVIFAERGTLLVNGDISASQVNVSLSFSSGAVFGGNGVLRGAVTVYASGILAPGATIGSIGTLSISNNLDLRGNVMVEVNKVLVQSNDFVIVGGTLTNTGIGTISVTNLGPALQVGDRFTLFSKPVQNGAALKLTGAGVNWANYLALDGSIVVASPILSLSQNGNDLQFSWVGDFKLMAQTNSLNVGLSTNWAEYPGGDNSPVLAPIDLGAETVWFALAPK